MLGFWAHYENLVKIPAKHGQDHSSSHLKKMLQHILDKVIPSPFQNVQNFMQVCTLDPNNNKIIYPQQHKIPYETSGHDIYQNSLKRISKKFSVWRFFCRKYLVHHTVLFLFGFGHQAVQHDRDIGPSKPAQAVFEN